MKALAMDKELVRNRVTFNTVAPGFIYIGGKDSEPSTELLEEIPAGVLGRPEDVAAAVVFLCSQQASYINGACLVVDGGESRTF